MVRLIIGIDFGTVATGAAFTFVNQESEQTVPKIPSELCNTGTVMKWGFEAQREAWGGKIKFMKLAFSGYSELELVDQSSGAEISSLGTYIPFGWTAATLIQSYLNFLHKHILECIKIRNTQIFGTPTMHYCFTVPVTWTDDQRNSLLAIARDAGIASSDTATMESIAELHAALLYLLSSSLYSVPDLVSFERLKDDDNHRIRGELISQRGILCGSILVNKAIRELVKARIGKERLQELSVKAYADLFRALDREFETFKLRFNGETSPLSWTINIEHNVTIPEANINKGNLVITRDDMVHAFSGPLNEVKKLLKEQVALDEWKGRRIKYVFLLGGFGASKYVADQLQTFLEESYNGRIRLIRVQY
ncbi:hypothetical protein BGX38DRAFT_1261648 [Terfezia claveryi]|nr:hypothetical protein BGX38DRAFT_1261648 [Terfezia claveryi]